MLLLKEKVNIFKDLCDLSPALDEGSQPIGERMLFRATPDEVTKGEPIIKDALKEGVCGWKERLRRVNLTEHCATQPHISSDISQQSKLLEHFHGLESN